MFGIFKKKFDFESFVAGSLEGLKIATDAHKNTWRLGQETLWNVDQDNGEISFEFKDGEVATSLVQIVGTFNSGDNTFMWGWNHPSIVPALQKDAFLVKKFGELHDLKELKKQKITCTESRAWELTALAMRLSGASGAYRAESSPGTFVFMTFGEVQLVKKT